ncbi:helix-turn-helix domain-containing protein [Carnobacterium maltaromaticum]|uniref:spr1629 family repressor/antitoxin n=1 Tax=Carnobacterium maltaromaticum TaxID=2751 RepID=UPI00165C3751|nr:XRE family transcriptional regulator [Carnobacterium maltaromaticum]MBC9789557.1 ImmA/IrrE family metallo-endopeptidase [Carnobacterium maltaromaticum]
MFVGSKLKDTRILHGFSRNELALSVGVTEQAIWQYEQNSIQPKFETLMKLSELFSVESKYYYKKNLLDHVTDENKIAYRNVDRQQKNKTISEAYYLDFVHMILSDLNNNVQLFNNQMIMIRNIVMNKRKNGSSIEECADIVRSQLKIISNQELMLTLEKNGIIILERELFSTKTDAYSTWVQEVPYIVLSSKSKSFVRRNFDLAHELGHLMLHYGEDITSLDKDDFKLIESEANDFASSFLMPREDFLADLSIIKGRISNPDYYIEMKKKYFVSIQAMGYNAYKLGEMSYRQNSYFFSQINKLKMHKVEPLDMDFLVIKPKKIVSFLDYLDKNKLYSIKEMLIQYDVKVEFFSKVFGIYPEFFYERISKEVSVTELFDFKKTKKLAN